MVKERPWWEKTFDHNQGHTKNEWGIKDEEEEKENNIH
jgi:hypothetical protein